MLLAIGPTRDAVCGAWSVACRIKSLSWRAPPELWAKKSPTFAHRMTLGLYRKCSTEDDHVLGRQFRGSSFDRAVRRKPMVRADRVEVWVFNAVVGRDLQRKGCAR